MCVTFLKRAVHHTGCFSLAFSMFYDLIAYVFSFDAVFSDLVLFTMCFRLLRTWRSEFYGQLSTLKT